MLSDHTIPDFDTSPSDAIVTMSPSPLAILGGKVPILHQPPGLALCVLERGDCAVASAFVFGRDMTSASGNRKGSRDGASSLGLGMVKSD